MNKIFFLIYFILFMTFCFIWPLYRLWKKEGILAITFKNTESAHDYIGRAFKLTVFMAGVPVILYACGENYFQYSLPFTTFPVIYSTIGYIFMTVALVWVTTAQVQMDKSWRIGIDYGKKTELVHSGLFTLSRNPIYFGIHLALLGFFLVLPNVISIVVLLLAHLMMQIQTRMEEEYLKNMHGKIYSDYCTKVRRWI